MNMPIFNFHKMIDMHKGYAYQFLILLPTKIAKKKMQKTILLEPNQNLWGN